MVARSPRSWSILATFNCMLSIWMASIGWAADAPTNIATPAATVVPSQQSQPIESPSSPVPSSSASSTDPTSLQLDGKEFRLSGPYRHDNLAVYFVHARTDDHRQFITLDEGLRKKLVTVREKDGGGTVQQLLIENRNDRPLYLQEGDRLSGGRQDRTVPYPLVIAPRSGEQAIPAFCIEQSRWSPGQRGEQFDAAGSAALAPRQVRAAARIKANQNAVWSSVATQKKAYAQGLSAGNTNSSLNETLDSGTVREAADHYLGKLKSPASDMGDIVGVAFAVDGRIEEVNVYAGNHLFSQVYPRLLESYAMEAALTLANIDPQAAAREQEERSLRTVLQGKITGRFDGRDLSRCIGDLSKKLGVEIDVDWAALQPNGVRRDDRITLQYRDEPAENVLLMVMAIAAQKSRDDVAMDVASGKVKLSRRSIVEQAQASRERVREYALERAKAGLDVKAAPPPLSNLVSFMHPDPSALVRPRELDSLHRMTVTEMKDRYYSCSEHNGVVINRQWMRVESASPAVVESNRQAASEP